MALITTAQLVCYQCENKFPINLNFKPKEVTCPFCQRSMASDMIEDLFTAAGTVSDLNYHFIKYHQERDESLFSLEISSQELNLPVDNIRQYPKG